MRKDKNRRPRLTLHRESLHRLDSSHLHAAAATDRGTVNTCPALSKLSPCSETPNHCWITDPTKGEPC